MVTGCIPTLLLAATCTVYPKPDTAPNNIAVLVGDGNILITISSPPNEKLVAST